jgi:hypothetical protein
MLPINKLFIDSRHKTSDSRSNTDFKFQLKESINLPDNTVAMITDVVIPNTIFTIEYFNENLYFRHVSNGVTTDHIIKLAHKNYDISTLRDELVNVLNTTTNTTAFQGEYNDQNGTITISITNNDTFYIFSDDDLKSSNMNFALYYDKTNLKSINEVISNIKQGPYNKDKPFVSGFVQCINPSCQSLYITCSQLGYNNLGGRGERNCIKRVCINLPFSYIVNDTFIEQSDFTDVSRVSLNKLDFQLVDSYGNVIDLKGPHISFSIIFRNIDSSGN